MLLEVDIRDFAIVRAARVELGGGLCVLSGETGAGKSIIIDAIGALLGARAGAEQIRAGANSARLRAVFDLSEVPVATRCLADLGAEVDPEGLCVITREITTSGRGRCTINGSTATLGMLRQLGEVLIDIHGQHEHQSLLRVSQHQAILDATGGAAVAAALADYRAAHAAWRETTEAIARLRLDEGEKARRADTLRFQVDEITKAELRLGEEEELNAERSRLAHAEKLLASAARAYAALAESDDVPAAADRVAEALHALHEMCHFDPQLGPLATDLEAALATVTEAARTLSGYVDELEADPQRLDHLEQRLDLIDRLKRRYGGSVAEIIAFGERAAGELEQIEGADEELARLEQRCGELAEALLACGGALTAARRAAAEALTVGVEAHLRDLGMAGARFAVSLTPRPPANQWIEVAGERRGVGPDGLDTVECLFSANPSEPPRPLARIASGGEISRVMLALKSEIAANDAIPTMVFDEIDVGIGGVTIHRVGQKMAAIAARRQVICITHHAPIAARADVHIAIEKAPGEDATVVDIRRLSGEAKVYELARMLGRQPPTEATLAMARELLDEVGQG